MAKHFAITINNSQPLQTPLKTYIRENPELFPTLDPDNHTTRHIRRNLVRNGWSRQVYNNEVFLVQPDDNGSFEYAEQIIDIIIEEANDEEERQEENYEVSFGLEKDLQAALRNNISSLENGLTIIDNGTEKTTTAGRIDITAKDRNGCTVVIELKAGTAKPDVIAQTLAYMTSLKHEGYQNIRGIIIANKFQDRVKLAAEAINNLELIEYSFQFAFKKVE